MSLNIKNGEAHQMAKELSDLTGESMTRAVTEAIRERRDRVKGDDPASDVEALLVIGRNCARHLDESTRGIDHGELLYGESGLPH